MKYYRIRIIALAALITLVSCGGPETTKPEKIADKKTGRHFEYGIDTDSLRITRGVVNRNETLADILGSAGIGYSKISEAAEKSKNVFDVTKIQPRKNYSFLKKNDSLQTLEYFIYEENPVDFVVFDFSDSIDVFLGKKEVTLRENTLAGKINSSLYETLSELEGSPKLAVLLADVFAWQIDFYTIQKGDYFKVIFYEKYVNGKFIGVDKILSAYFNHNGRGFYAFEYVQEKKRDFFDEKGNSLRKAFLKAPVKFTRISSKFSRRRFHPILRIYRPHLGIDYAAPTGTPVVAVGNGTVIDKRWTKGGGRFVKIRHNSAYQSGYMHLSKYGKGIQIGAEVKQGQIIGYVGSSGLATGPHLDFRFWKNGTLINYLKAEFPPSHPIEKSEKEKYMFIMKNYKRKLDATPIETSKPNV